MRKFTNTLINRNTGKELKKQLKAERAARVRVEAIKDKATRTEWQEELRRLGFK